MTEQISPRRRFNIKQLLLHQQIRQQLIDGAVDFICKVERIRN